MQHVTSKSALEPGINIFLKALYFLLIQTVPNLLSFWKDIKSDKPDLYFYMQIITSGVLFLQGWYNIKQYLEIVGLHDNCFSFSYTFITYNINLQKWIILMDLFIFYSRHFTGSPGAVITGRVQCLSKFTRHFISCGKCNLESHSLKTFKLLLFCLEISYQS